AWHRLQRGSRTTRDRTSNWVWMLSGRVLKAVVVDRAAAEFVYMGSPKADDRHAMSSRGRSANGPPRDDVRSVPKSLPVPAAASADVSLAINASKVLAASYSFEETHPSAYLRSEERRVGKESTYHG